MNRRQFLAAAGGGATGALAGCTAAPDSTPSETDTSTDSDGDGVSDANDYAPRDPAVQSKSDLDSETQTTLRDATDTPTPIPRATPTETRTAAPTPTATPTSRPRRVNTIHADSDDAVGFTHHLVEYSSTHAVVRLYGSSDLESLGDSVVLYVIARVYPDDGSRVFAYNTSDAFAPPGSGERVVSVSFDSQIASDAPFFYGLVLAPADTDVQDLSSDETMMVCESDRLRVNTAGQLSKAPPAHELGDVDTDRYRRTTTEGAYLLRFEGETYNEAWSAGFVAFKHGHIEDVFARQYDDYRDYVYEASNEGLVNQFGAILAEEAERNGITGAREQVEFLIDFTQNLPYVPDDVSTGFDDYTKRIVESLVDGGGDCEDSSILLASLLVSDAFGYGVALLLLPGHMALGVKGGEDLAGSYYEENGTRYFYVETTGRGWRVGEIPEEYQGESAYVMVV